METVDRGVMKEHMMVLSNTAESNIFTITMSHDCFLTKWACKGLMTFRCLLTMAGCIEKLISLDCL